MASVLNTIKRLGDPGSMANINDLDPELRKAIEGTRGPARMTSNEIVDSNLEGSQAAARNMVQDLPGQLNMSRASLGQSEDKALTQALTDRVNRNVNRGLDRQQTISRLGAPMQRFNNLGQGQDIYRGLVKYDINRETQLYEIRNQRSAMKNQLLGGLLGVAGMGAGIYAKGKMNNNAASTATANDYIPSGNEEMGSLQPTPMMEP